MGPFTGIGDGAGHIHKRHFGEILSGKSKYAGYFQLASGDIFRVNALINFGQILSPAC